MATYEEQIKRLEREYKKTGDPVILGAIEIVKHRIVQSTIEQVTSVVHENLSTQAPRQVSTSASRYLNLKLMDEIPVLTKSMKENIGFSFIMAFRESNRLWKSRHSPSMIRYLNAFAEGLADLLESRMLGKIMQNIRQSFIEGGRLSDDVEGTVTWKPLSDKYVKYRKGGDTRFGVLSGYLFRHLWRGGQIALGKGMGLRVHFHPKHGGAREFSIDFGRGRTGEKLALFYFGRSKGRGRQPARPFTFLTKRDFAELEAVATEHFKSARGAFIEFFTAMYAGPMPVIKGTGFPKPRFQKLSLGV